MARLNQIFDEYKSLMAEKLKNFESVTFQERLDVISNILVEMLKEKEAKAENEPPNKKTKEDQILGIKDYMMVMRNKIMLVYSLLAYHIANATNEMKKNC